MKKGGAYPEARAEKGIMFESTYFHKSMTPPCAGWSSSMGKKGQPACDQVCSIKIEAPFDQSTWVWMFNFHTLW